MPARSAELCTNDVFGHGALLNGEAHAHLYDAAAVGGISFEGDFPARIGKILPRNRHSAIAEMENMHYLCEQKTRHIIYSPLNNIRL